VALTLAAGNNKIEYLPPEIFTPLQALRELHLYKNKITAVPPEIGNLVCMWCGFELSVVGGSNLLLLQTSQLSLLIIMLAGCGPVVVSNPAVLPAVSILPARGLMSLRGEPLSTLSLTRGFCRRNHRIVLHTGIIRFDVLALV
jgi:Leucine-rich repeat (LRR) protein